MKSTAVTIKELSFLSGFSVSTVSKALNNKQDISETTRKTIRGLDNERNYVPNNYAVGLRGKLPSAIAVILPKVTDSYYSSALCHLQKLAENNGCRIIFFQSFNDTSKEIDYIKSLNDGSAKGIILISENRLDNDLNLSIIPKVELSISSNNSLNEINESCEKAFSEILNIN